MFPLNVVRREALEQVVPSAQKHDVGMVIMKPMSVGMAPAEIALPWLANQPIHTMAPGVSNLEQLELDARVLDRSPMALSPAEELEAERWRLALDMQACRICDRVCQPVCEPKIPIDVLIYHDVMYNEARALGKEGFLAAPMAPWVRSRAEDHFNRVAQTVDTCTHCGKCEEACPYHLPIMGLLDRVKADSEDMAEALREAGWKQAAGDAPPPWAKPGRGGRRFMS
jgi:predicted aldo/keto reductase-like oxidoreductase